MPRFEVEKVVQENSIKLTKDGSSLRKVRLVLGWEGDNELDLDASCFLLNSEKKCLDRHNLVFFGSVLKMPAKDNEGHFIFKQDTRKGYNPRTKQVEEYIEEVPIWAYTSKCGNVVHHGDARIGTGGDDEQISVNLEKFGTTGGTEDIRGVLFVITIYKVKSLGMSFANASSINVEIFDESNEKQPPILLHKYSISTTRHKDKYSMIVGGIVRNNGLWEYQSYEKLEKKTLEDYMLQFEYPYMQKEAPLSLI